MESGEGDHPLRSDPLNSLPDAISIPRRPRRVAADSTPPLQIKAADEDFRLPHKPQPPASSFEQRAFEEEALALLRSKSADDPLINAIGERTLRPPSPPAGNAFATDIHQALAAIEDPRDDRDAPPVAAGLVDRSDVTLFASEPERGSAAGVYIVRSRRNWAFGAASSAGPSTGPNPNQTSEPEYYHVRRSIADFVWLEDRLRTRYEGIIVPPLPSMALAGRLNHGYAYEVERLRGLERFLRRVATHAVLSTGDEVLSFLGATGEESWGKLRREHISHESAVTTVLFGGSRASDDATAVERMSRWSEKMLWQAGRKLNKGLVWFLERDPPSDVRQKEDSAEARLERLQTYVQELGISLSAVRMAAKRVATNRHQEIRGVTAMQTALHKLAEREGGKFGALVNGVLLDVTPESLSSTSPTHGSQAEGSASDERPSQPETSTSVPSALPPDRVLDEVFQDYEERAKGAQRIMNARKEEQEAYEHAVAVYTKLRDRLESRTGSMWETVPSTNTLPSSGEGLEELVSDVNSASSRLAEVRKHYQAVAVSTTDELRRLRVDMHGDLCDALRGIAIEYSRQHKAHSIAWASLAESLQNYQDPSPRQN